jgi:hypothetical protein
MSTDLSVAITSDLHANLEAIGALPSGAIRLWVLGGLANYGPNPRGHP